MNQEQRRRLEAASFVAPPQGSPSLLGRLREQVRWSLTRHIETFCRPFALEPDALTERFSSLDTSRKWRPEFFWYCHRLHLALERNNVNLGVDSMHRLRCIDVDDVYCTGTRIRGLFEQRWDREWAEDTRAIAAGRRQSMSLRPLLDDRYRRYHDALEQARARLQEVDPKTYAEHDEHCAEICLFGGNFTSSQNVDTAFGMMAFGFGPQVPDLDGFILGQLAHEAGHMRLCTMMDLQELFVDDGAPKYRLSVRSDARPMAAVFHAAFVYARTIRVLERALDHYPKNESFHRKFTSTIPAFRKAYDILTKEAVLTPSGQHLVDSIPTVFESRWQA